MSLQREEVGILATGMNAHSFLISQISDVHAQTHFNGESPDDQTIGLPQSMERNLDMDA